MTGGATLMSGGNPSGALREIRTLFSDGMLGGLTDGQLLERFVNRSDSSAAEEAFAVLLERHGPMVWGVCRRLLTDQDAAADAFQATFLVLVRRAPTVRVADSLGPWLYGVTRRVAARARADSLRRRSRETGGVETLAADPAPDPDPHRAEQRTILDEEIGRLSEHQRAAIVLCDLEGLPHEEAARRLGCPVGTVESRLSRARRRLRDRLIRRGVAPAAAALWAEMARETSAAMPRALLRQSTWLVTKPPAAGVVPAGVAALAEGVIQMMRIARLKPLLAITGATILATAGIAVQGRPQAGPEKAREPARTAAPPKAGASDIDANKALARQQLALIDRAETSLYELLRKGAVAMSDPAFSLWRHRRLEALRKAGAGKVEIVAALEKYLRQSKEDEARAETMSARREIAQSDVLDVRYRRLEAEIWLNEEKAR